MHRCPVCGKQVEQILLEHHVNAHFEDPIPGTAVAQPAAAANLLPVVNCSFGSAEPVPQQHSRGHEIDDR